jgi:hypothetical protein
MQFTFLDTANVVLFVRDDAESASWTVEEKSLTADFPYRSDKVIEIDQRIVFEDPSTGDVQIYEVRNAKTVEPENFQQIIAENICISELTDEHMEAQELTDVTCSTALSGVLTGTLWQVGTTSVNPTSSADLSRGSVWQAVLDIQSNWNVYIEPRFTLDDDGTITRYLDIKSPDGTWNGVRLSVDKNFLDPSVTYDDTELATALYGYGGMISATTSTGEDTECTFADVVWTATDDHPAKPDGQTYLEYPAATAEYGRNGRARFGFYQNSDITDPVTLLEKTWEALKNAATPTISIEGTVEDLYRLGYADEPIRLHDIALVEVLPAGFKKQLQIIRMTVNLLDPTETAVSIGAYLPNIIYIDRDLNDDVTGSRGGGGNKNKTVNEWREFRTTIQQFADGTGLRFQAVQNDINNQEEEIAVQTGRIDVAYNNIALEVQDRRDADNELSSSISLTASQIRSEVSAANSAIYSTIIQTASSISSAIIDTESGLYSYIQQTASGIRQTIVSKTNQTWIQDSDPRSAAGGGHTPKAGDIWVESTHQGTWDGADGFDWGWDEQYDWFAIQGAKVYGWQNDKWELISDQQQVITWSDVVNTADHIVSQKIKRIVNDAGLLEVYLSKLEQTAQEIRAEVSTADSAIYSYIIETASSINLGVSARPSAVISTTAPTSIQGRSPVANDIWIQSNFQNTWDAALNHDWNDDTNLTWGEVRSDKVYVYNDGAWHEAVDGTVVAEDADLQVQSSLIEMNTKRIEVAEGEIKANYASFKVDAAQIRSTVEERVRGLGSSITQTASQIRAEVHAANSQIYSTITQTASSIRSEVANSISGVQSSITQTASSIRSEVSASNSRIYTTISQTATGIRTDVNNSIAGVNSSISQTAWSIRSEVAAANSTIYSTITQTAGSIRSEVASANSAVYSTITQTASSIRSEVANTASGLQSSITQNANKIALVVEDDGAGGNRIKTASIVAGINAQTGSYVKISADTINLSGYVTASQLNAQKARIDNLISGDTTATWLKAVNGNISSMTIGNNLSFKSHGVYWQAVTINGTNYHFMGYVG